MSQALSEQDVGKIVRHVLIFPEKGFIESQNTSYLGSSLGMFSFLTDEGRRLQGSMPEISGDLYELSTRFRLYYTNHDRSKKSFCEALSDNELATVYRRIELMRGIIQEIGDLPKENLEERISKSPLSIMSLLSCNLYLGINSPFYEFFDKSIYARFDFDDPSEKVYNVNLEVSDNFKDVLRRVLNLSRGMISDRLLEAAILQELREEESYRATRDTEFDAISKKYAPLIELVRKTDMKSGSVKVEKTIYEEVLAAAVRFKPFLTAEELQNADKTARLHNLPRAITKTQGLLIGYDPTHTSSRRLNALLDLKCQNFPSSL